MKMSHFPFRVQESYLKSCNFGAFFSHKNPLYELIWILFCLQVVKNGLDLLVRGAPIDMLNP